MAPGVHEPTIREQDDERKNLTSMSFIGLVLTQFLGAANDNIFRWYVIGIGKEKYPEDVGAILMAGTACMVAPYLFFAPHAAFFADRYSKRSVILACKIAEIVIMLLGLCLAWNGHLPWLFSVVFLLGAQSAMYGPAKLGAIPEILKTKHISSANGIIGLATVVATALGTIVGNLLSDVTKQGTTNLWIAGLIMVGCAAIGIWTSTWIQRLPVNQPDLKFPWNPFRSVWKDLKVLRMNHAIFHVAVGSAFFWTLAALAQLNIDQFASESGTTTQSDVGPLLAVLVVGTAVGCVLAGYWSQGHVEMGILPLGATGLAICSFLLFLTPSNIVNEVGSWNFVFVFASLLLFFMGLSAGLFEVPLASFLQHRAPAEKRGTILAATNFLTFGGILFISIVFWGLTERVYDGDVENIGQIAKLEISPEFKTKVQETSKLFEQQLAEKQTTADPAELAKALSSNAEEEKYAFASLLLTQLRHAFADKTPLERSKLVEKYPDDKRLVGQVFLQATRLPILSSRQIFLLCSAVTIPILFYILYLLPQNSLRFLVWLASETFYRIRVHDRENLPAEGGALLVSNHVSWLDGVLLMLTSSRPVRMLVWGGNFKSEWFRRFVEYHGAILIDKGPKGIQRALQAGREAIENGELVCVFAEGGITRSGQIQGFRPGLLKMVEGTSAPVVPVFIDELWGSAFTFSEGRFFWKWPRSLQTPISIHFGEPINPPYGIHEIRQAVQQLGAIAFKRRVDRVIPPAKSLLRICKGRLFGSKVADSTGVDLSGGVFLTRILVLRRLLNRHILKPRKEEQYVGVLLPPSVAGAAVNGALALDRRVAVNLNYTTSNDVMNYCIKKCGIQSVLTSRKFMDKFDWQLECNVVYLEDLASKPTTWDKISCAFTAFVTPSWILDRVYGLNKIGPNDTLTVIFTSGSTGVPKGVQLTHANVSSNVQAIQQMIHLNRNDVIIGILPFFHSFGYTVTLWTLFGIDVKLAYHFSPLEPKVIGNLTKKHKGTAILVTPTFLRSYLRRVDKEAFATLEIVVAGAEKLPGDLSDAFEEKFGVRPVEGYGTTELSPLVAVNIPPARSIDNFQIDRKEGTVGRPIPNVAARIIDLDTGEEKGANEAGMLYITGPNVMKGYYDMPEETADVLQDGWYKTGDVALIDEDGFLKITGRVSRFSKIGGEMIPHVRIEEAIQSILGPNESEEDGIEVAVTAVDHPTKGERIVVVHIPMELTPAEICQRLKQAGLPNLFIPATDSFVQVDKIPILGTGKLDLRELKELAKARFSENGTTA
ncbi:MFS transporter [Bremerella cremea]|uniref:MFS transporter n=1 Tax=Bremerella cremea TaxID=1031537 RepID=A0A368KWN7_9BACT|nr:MFS transporter [Bremerella cremea]RCS54830.1 MFS transporter [Bremerella cremea]